MHFLLVFALVYRVAIVSLAGDPRMVHVHVDFASVAPPAAASSAVPLSPKASNPASESPPQHAREGDHRTFWVQYVDGAQPHARPQWTSVNAALEYSTEHTDLWEDDEVDGLQSARFEAMSKQAESGYISQHGRFGSLSYSETDRGRHRCQGEPEFAPSRGELLTILVVGPDKTKTGFADVGSYVSSPGLACFRLEHTNELPGLLVIPLLDPTTDPIGKILEMGPAHELQHLKNFVRHAIRGAGAKEDNTLNEGLSVLAEDFEAQLLYNRRDVDGAGLLARDYLNDPNAVSLLSFYAYDGQEGHPSGPTSYGGAYLLQRYLYDRFGDTYLDRVTDTDKQGLSAIAGALPISVPDALRDFGGFVLNEKRRAELRTIPGTDFNILGGSVSLYESSTPIQSIRATGSNVVWTQVAQ